MSVRIEKKGKEAYLRFPNLEKLGFLNHCVTTRAGGFSKGPFKGMNMGLFTEDSREAVLMNHEKAAEHMGYELDDAVFTNQVHGVEIALIDEEFRGERFWLGERALEKDAIITRMPGRPIVAFFADCAGVFVADPVQKAEGIAHAGWKGTVKEIGCKTIEAMGEAFGSKASDCHAVVGPSIGPCCFEVQEEVAELFSELCGESVLLGTEKPGRWKVDLWEANRMQLAKAGVKAENIGVSGLCTFCRDDLFYSHRRDKGKTGRMAGIMEIV